MFAEAEVLTIWLPRISETIAGSFACVESLAVSNRPASDKSAGGCWTLRSLSFRFGLETILGPGDDKVRFGPPNTGHSKSIIMRTTALRQERTFADNPCYGMFSQAQTFAESQLMTLVA